MEIIKKWCKEILLDGGTVQYLRYEKQQRFHLVNGLAPVMPSITSIVASVVSVFVPLLHFVFEFLA
jgi:hypothetical protein